MNRGYLYFVLALAAFSIWLTDAAWPWKALLTWIGLSGLYFGIGYVTAWGEIMAKSRHGRLPWAMKLLLLPVLVGVVVYHRIAKKIDQAEPLHEIRPGLWLGRRLTLTERTLLEENDITAILDVTAEFDTPCSDLLGDDIAYLNIPVFDRHRPRIGQLAAAVKWIARQRAHNRQVLIHCALGQGRSVTALMAYLLYSDPDADLHDILKEIQGIRSVANPNALQLRLLARFQASEARRQKPRMFVVLNPVSGKRDPQKDRSLLIELLGPFYKLRILETTPDVGAEELTHRALEEKADQVLAAGGDGTVAAVAGVLAGTDVPMGIIPRGTANSLATCLYGLSVQADPVGTCCRHILAGSTRAIDIARCDGRVMVLLAGIGIEAGMIEKAEREAKDQWGVLAYLVGAWQQIDEQKPFQLRLEVDGQEEKLEASCVTVANAAPPSSVFAQGRGTPDLADGKLDVTIVTDFKSRAHAVETMSKLFVGTYAESESRDQTVLHFSGKKIRIETEPAQSFILDGDVAGETPLTLEAEQAALKVFFDQELVRSSE
ncbi:MAG: diacylglycerol kinase family protein [Puniceicoccales bacterium]